MVPQQISDVRSMTPNSNVPVFGSQLVDKNSSTPYTDATQVSACSIFLSVVENTLDVGVFEFFFRWFDRFTWKFCVGKSF